MRKRKIAIVVTTYRRNHGLLGLVKQLRELRDAYMGPNEYSLHVTDSDPRNEIEATLVAQGVDYVINPGSGFDDNLLSFYDRLHRRDIDYVLSMSDDDRIAADEPKALSKLDAALDVAFDAYLFNHRGFRVSPIGVRLDGPAYYSPMVASFTPLQLKDMSLGLLPRHIGLVYSVAFLLRHRPTWSRFRGTQHLYAAPFLIACCNQSASFINESLFWFHQDVHEDGAWSNWAEVFQGLVRFLQALRAVIPAEAYATAENGFFANYLGEHAWLRGMVSSRVVLPSIVELKNQLQEPLGVEMESWNVVLD